MLTLSKQSSRQTLNHTKEILTYARIMVTTAGFEPTSPSPVTWRVPYSISSCVCFVRFTSYIKTQTGQDGSVFRRIQRQLKRKRKDKPKLFYCGIFIFGVAVVRNKQDYDHIKQHKYWGFVPMGAEGRTWTDDLKVMSLASCQLLHSAIYRSSESYGKDQNFGS